MVDAGVAQKLSTEVLYNMNGEITLNKGEAVGLPSRYLIIDPDNIFLVDETGNNTNQKEDARIGGEKMIVPTDGSCDGRSSNTSDAHWTTLVFQTASGTPVCCCVIFKSDGSPDDIPLNWRTGIDITCAADLGNSILTDEQLAEKASGLCKGGPVCQFRGKSIPCYVTCSPKASITSQLLADCLAYIDSFNVVKRQNGVKPFLLLDGHHSQFEVPFLEYIHDDNHAWVACIGVPYGTQWWQVADSLVLWVCFCCVVVPCRRLHGPEDQY